MVIVKHSAPRGPAALQASCRNRWLEGEEQKHKSGQRTGGNDVTGREAAQGLELEIAL